MRPKIIHPELLGVVLDNCYELECAKETLEKYAPDFDNECKELKEKLDNGQCTAELSPQASNIVIYGFEQKAREKDFKARIVLLGFRRAVEQISTKKSMYIA